MVNRVTSRSLIIEQPDSKSSVKLKIKQLLEKLRTEEVNEKQVGNRRTLSRSE